MTCVFCGNIKTSTVNSRKSTESCRVWRRHQCERCGRLFSSHETPYLDNSIIVLDEKGAESRFSSTAVMSKLDEAFSVAGDHTADSVRSHTEHIFNTVIQKVANRCKTHPSKPTSYTITASEIDKIVLDILFDYNEKAYYRYLSST